MIDFSVDAPFPMSRILVRNARLGLAAIFVVVLTTTLSSTAQEGNRRVAFHGSKLSIELASDWTSVERPGALAAFASADRTSSFFITVAGSTDASTMDEVLNGAVADFEQAFKVSEKGEYKWGKVKGPAKEWNAIFTTLELEMVGKPENIPFRFYLTIFDTGTALYLIQASTVKPLKADREREIIAMIRSVIAAP